MCAHPSSSSLRRSVVVVAALFAALGGALACASSSGGDRASRQAQDAETTAPTAADVVRMELERVSPRQLDPALAPDVDPEVRARAALALARLEHVHAAPLLLRAADDETAAVRRHAAFGLGQLDLALTPELRSHEELRARVEAFLVEWDGREQSPAVREAILRALGRVSTKQGLTHLLAVARAGERRATALYALGVSGARRSSSLSADEGLLKVVLAGLAADDVEVRRAAAYAAFRQKVPLSAAALAKAADEPDAAARIHLARALPEAKDDVTAIARALLQDGDWRVRVEAVRALVATARRGASLPVDELRRTGEAAARALAKGGAGGEGHVVTTVCDALGDPGLPLPPEDLRPAASALLGALPATEAFAAARCRCAVALDALSSRIDAVRTCAPSWSDERVRRLEVQVAAKARLSSRERVAWLEKVLASPAVPVRVQAAWALVEDGSRHAAEVGAARLEREDDPAVAAALLQLFVGDHREALGDVALARVVDRFYDASSLEGAEPLLEAAKLLVDRPSAPAQAAADRLRTHVEPRVRDVVGGVPSGERAPGPRAMVPPLTTLDELPASAVLVTERGAITLAFDRATAPVTVESFVALARKGFFDGLAFHRVVPDFVAQGGDPRGDGSGGPGYSIPCENSDGSYERGAVGMALAGKDTGGSQFFLTHSEQPHLDGRYTIFARVTSGLEAMDALMPDDRILSVQLPGATPAEEAAPAAPRR